MAGCHWSELWSEGATPPACSLTASLNHKSSTRHIRLLLPPCGQNWQYCFIFLLLLQRISIAWHYYIFNNYSLTVQSDGSQQWIRSIDVSLNRDRTARLFSQTTIRANTPLHAHIKTLPTLMKFVNGSHGHVSTLLIRGSR